MESKYLSDLANYNNHTLYLASDGSLFHSVSIFQSLFSQVSKRQLEQREGQSTEQQKH